MQARRAVRREGLRFERWEDLKDFQSSTPYLLSSCCYLKKNTFEIQRLRSNYLLANEDYAQDFQPLSRRLCFFFLRRQDATCAGANEHNQSEEVHYSDGSD